MNLYDHSPHLEHEWSFHLNQYEHLKNRKHPISPSDISYGSRRKVWWTCARGHSWKTTPNNRTSAKSMCPYCANKKAWEGYNDLGTTYPEISQYLVNQQLSTTLLGKSNIKVDWWCENGENHMFDMTVAHRTSRHGCPYCSNQRVLPGFNDLATTRPDIAAHVSKNSHFSAQEVHQDSNKKLLFLCENGENHEYLIKVSSRSTGSGCHYCSSTLLLPGFNDLATKYPELLDDWDWEKNTKTPDQLFPTTIYTAFWICQTCGFRWSSLLRNRTERKFGCVRCRGSLGQKQLAEYLSTLTDTTLIYNDTTVLPGKHELDIYLPELCLAFEYNGDWWHSFDNIFERTGKTDVEYHTWKIEESGKKGVRLFYVWESNWKKNRTTVEKEISLIFSQQSYISPLLRQLSISSESPV